MRKRRIPLGIAAALTALALTGCGDDDPIQRAQDTAQNAADKAQQKALEGAIIAALTAIDPELAKDPQRALVQAKAACAVIENGTAAQGAAEARKRFGSSSVKIDDAEAKQIVRVLKKDLCPRL